jgi:hypothetical protein
MLKPMLCWAVLSVVFPWNLYAQGTQFNLFSKRITPDTNLGTNNAGLPIANDPNGDRPPTIAPTVTNVASAAAVSAYSGMNTVQQPAQTYTHDTYAERTSAATAEVDGLIADQVSRATSFCLAAIGDRAYNPQQEIDVASMTSLSSGSGWALTSWTAGGAIETEWLVEERNVDDPSIPIVGQATLRGNFLMHGDNTSTNANALAAGATVFVSIGTSTVTATYDGANWSVTYNISTSSTADPNSAPITFQDGTGLGFTVNQDCTEWVAVQDPGAVTVNNAALIRMLSTVSNIAGQDGNVSGGVQGTGQLIQLELMGSGLFSVTSP